MNAIFGKSMVLLLLSCNIAFFCFSFVLVILFCFALVLSCYCFVLFFFFSFSGKHTILLLKSMLCAFSYNTAPVEFPETRQIL